MKTKLLSLMIAMACISGLLVTSVEAVNPEVIAVLGASWADCIQADDRGNVCSSSCNFISSWRTGELPNYVDCVQMPKVVLNTITHNGEEASCTCLGWDNVTVTWKGSAPETWTGRYGETVPIPWIYCGTTVNINSSENCSCLASHLFDVYFLSDTTGSMSYIIEEVKQAASTIMNTLRYSYPMMAFGVGNYKNFGIVLKEGGTVPCFDHQLNPTEDVSVAQVKIDEWDANFGAGGAPEGQLYALFRLATDSTIIWRDGARRIIVWLGDEPGQDPICASDAGQQITEQDVIDKLITSKITVLAISLEDDGLNGNPNNTFYSCTQNGTVGQANRITEATGGLCVSGIDKTDVCAEIVDMVTSYANNFRSPVSTKFTPGTASTYTVELNAACDNQICPPCVIYIQIGEIVFPDASAEVNDNCICQGDSINLIGGPADMVSYSWTGIGFTSATQSPTIDGIITTNMPAGIYDYTLTVTDANGCTDNATVTLTVNQMPVAKPSIDKTSICKGDQFTISGKDSTGTGPLIYTWACSCSNCSGTPCINSFNTSSPTITLLSDAFPAGDYTFTLTVKDSTPCPSATASVKVTVYDKPIAKITIDPNKTTFCQGEQFTLDGSGSIGTGGINSYIWKCNGTSTCPGNWLAYGPSLNIDTKPYVPGKYTFTLSFKDTTPCPAETHVDVIIANPRIIDFHVSDNCVKQGDKVELFWDVKDADTWTTDAPVDLKLPKGSASVYPAVGETMYTLNATSGPCNDIKTITVTVASRERCPEDCNCMPEYEAEQRDSIFRCRDIPCACSDLNIPEYCYSVRNTPCRNRECECLSYKQVSQLEDPPNKVGVLCQTGLCGNDAQGNPQSCYRFIKKFGPDDYDDIPLTVCTNGCDCITENESVRLGYTVLGSMEPCKKTPGQATKFCFRQCPEGCECLTKVEADKQNYTTPCGEGNCSAEGNTPNQCFGPALQPCSADCQCLTPAEADTIGFTETDRSQKQPCAYEKGTWMYCYPKQAPNKPVITLFNPSRTLVTYGEPVTFSYRITGADSAWFTCAGEKRTVSPTSGSISIMPPVSGCCILTAINKWGETQKTHCVTVIQRTPIRPPETPPVAPPVPPPDTPPTCPTCPTTDGPYWAPGT